jgi:hypothetical protein
MFTISWKQCWQLFAITWFPSDLIETVMAIISVVQIVSSARRLQTWFTFLLFLQCFLNWNDCFCARGTLTSLNFIGIKEQRALSLSLQCRSAVVRGVLQQRFTANGVQVVEMRIL